MATMLLDLVEPTWRGLADLEYGYWMMRFGEALEKHEDHQGEKGVPPPLAGPAKIIDGGNRMVALAMAAGGGDRFRKAEVEGYRQQAGACQASCRSVLASRIHYAVTVFSLGACVYD